MKITKKIWVDFKNESIISSRDKLIGDIAKEHELIVKSNWALGDFLKQHKNYHSAVAMFNDMLKNEIIINDLYREFDKYAYEITEANILKRYTQIEIEL